MKLKNPLDQNVTAVPNRILYQQIYYNRINLMQ
jgi:hypothetical protein